jgi:ATP-dependent Clp protease ATP-binding subunit ClpA
VDVGVSAHFADDGRAAVAAAGEAAREHNAAEVSSEHLLAGLMRHGGDDLTALLAPYGLTAETASRRILPGRPSDPPVSAPVFSKRVKGVLQIANMAAQQRNGRIGCATILAALLARHDGSVTAYLRTHDEMERLTAAVAALDAS